MRKLSFFAGALSFIITQLAQAACHPPQLFIFSPHIIDEGHHVIARAKILPATFPTSLNYHFEYRALGASQWVPDCEQNKIFTQEQKVSNASQYEFTPGYTYFVRLVVTQTCDQHTYFSEKLDFKTIAK